LIAVALVKLTKHPGPLTLVPIAYLVTSGYATSLVHGNARRAREVPCDTPAQPGNLT
jgi:hypothetical protein